ncbi:MAG: hypothetical protein ABSB91_02235 [Sedimentisphaerales bacterium]
MTKKYVKHMKRNTVIEFADVMNKYNEINKLTLKNDWFALIIIYATIEMTLDVYLKAKCKYGSNFIKPNIPIISKAALLRELNVIDDKMYGYISIVKELRNKFAHSLTIGDEWSKKLIFDKSDSYYEQYLKEKKHKPEELRYRLSYVLYRLLITGTDSISEVIEIKE